MAKVLIINDQPFISKALQENLYELNPTLFANKNVFCLSKENDYVITLMDEQKIEVIRQIDKKTIKDIIQVILKFLEEYREEQVFILIDGNLVSSKSYAPLFTCFNDLSAFIYAVLIMVINGKNNFNNEEFNISSQKVSFLLYSDTDWWLTRIITSLEEIYIKLNEENKKYFPKEAILPENISFVVGGGESTSYYIDGHQEISSNKYSSLKLSNSYQEFIKKI